ncbi:MAG: uracil-DNA glycosylase family protein [Hyphomicrobiaceae bacterium]
MRSAKSVPGPSEVDGAPASRRPGPGDTTDVSLERLVAEIKACRRCIDAPAGKPLAHTPRPVLRVTSKSRIVVAGQAPGTRVHASGVPFTDPSGDRLRDWMGVSLEEFYDVGRIAVVPMGFCFPGLDANGGDLPPRRECAPMWRRQLLDNLPAVELLLPIGLHAHKWHLPRLARLGVTETVRRFEEALATPVRPRLLPLPHPSWRNNRWIKDNPWFEAEVVPRLRREVRRLLDAP